jgi:hypothetical protein
MQHSFGLQATTLTKSLFENTGNLFYALDDFVTKHFNPVSVFMKNPSYLSIQQSGLVILPHVQIPLILFGEK